MDQILEQLESSLGVPVELLERAASARAAVAGSSAENIARSWVGEAPVDSAAAPEPAPAPAAPAAESEPAAEPEEPELEVEVLEAQQPPPSEAADDQVEEDAPVGAMSGFPAWLAAALVMIPVLAFAYVLIAPNGPGCGTSGQLAIDPESGLAENCDGTEYGVDTVSFFSIGQDIYEGAGACAGCHAADGSGGTGPAMAGGAVLVTFPEESCADHVLWIELGTQDWPEATYGANATPVGSSGAAMPGFEGRLTPEEIAAVVIYERVAFGGQSLVDAEEDCGVAELEVAAGE